MTTLERQAWQSSGSCNGMAPSLFFPERGESSAYAKVICGKCPVLEACRSFALDNPELASHGVWGGLTESERRQSRGVVVRGERVVCGTRGGYARHVRRGEPTCELCRLASAEYIRRSRGSYS